MKSSNKGCMYKVWWSSFCCDTGYSCGVDECDSLQEALALWVMHNDPRNSDGPCSAAIFRFDDTCVDDGGVEEEKMSRSLADLAIAATNSRSSLCESIKGLEMCIAVAKDALNAVDERRLVFRSAANTAHKLHFESLAS